MALRATARRALTCEDRASELETQLDALVRRVASGLLDKVGSGRSSQARDRVVVTHSRDRWPLSRRERRAGGTGPRPRQPGPVGRMQGLRPQPRQRARERRAPLRATNPATPALWVTWRRYPTSATSRAAVFATPRCGASRGSCSTATSCRPSPAPHDRAAGVDEVCRAGAAQMGTRRRANSQTSRGRLTPVS